MFRSKSWRSALPCSMFLIRGLLRDEEMGGRRSGYGTDPIMSGSPISRPVPADSHANPNTSKHGPSKDVVEERNRSVCDGCEPRYSVVQLTYERAYLGCGRGWPSSADLLRNVFHLLSRQMFFRYLRLIGIERPLFPGSGEYRSSAHCCSCPRVGMIVG